MDLLINAFNRAVVSCNEVKQDLWNDIVLSSTERSETRQIEHGARIRPIPPRSSRTGQKQKQSSWYTEIN